jgi:hypothetical protein
VFAIEQVAAWALSPQVERQTNAGRIAAICRRAIGVAISAPRYLAWSHTALGLLLQSVRPDEAEQAFQRATATLAPLKLPIEDARIAAARVNVVQKRIHRELVPSIAGARETLDRAGADGRATSLTAGNGTAAASTFGGSRSLAASIAGGSMASRR